MAGVAVKEYNIGHVTILGNPPKKRNEMSNKRKWSSSFHVTVVFWGVIQIIFEAQSDKREIPWTSVFGARLRLWDG